MKGAFTVTKSIPFEEFSDLRLPREVQLRRVKKVICRELTQNQREVLMAYYFAGLTIPQIAEARGVNKSTVCRTLHRAEQRLQRCLRY